MIRSETNKIWSNWSGSVTFTPKQIFYPKSIEEVILIVRRTKLAGKYLRVVGSGYSFSPLVQTDQILLSLQMLEGIENINEAEHTVTVFAGTKLKDLAEALATSGYAVENFGDSNELTIAGALSSGTHGTGVQFGILSTVVVTIWIITAEGKLVECSEDKNEDLFRAAQLSLGLLGIIIKITLRIVPMYRLHLLTYQMDFDQCITEIENLRVENRNFGFLWFPYTKTVQVRTMNESTEEKSEENIWRNLKTSAFETWLFSLLSTICTWFPKLCKSIGNFSAKTIPSIEKIDDSHKIFFARRSVRFHEMEYFVPIEHFEAVVREIEETIEREQFNVHFPLEYRFVKGDEIWLSPAYQQDSVAIAVHMYSRMPYEEYFRAIEAIFHKYNGRPHWGKWHTLTKERAERLFPKIKDFKKLRSALDPYDTFLNPYLQKLFDTDYSKDPSSLFTVEQTVDAVRAMTKDE